MADEERLKEFKEANKIVFDPNTRQVWENQNRDGTKPATTFQSEEDIKELPQNLKKTPPPHQVLFQHYKTLWQL